MKLFRGPGLRLERAARISCGFFCGPAMGCSEVPERVFSSLGLRPASPVGVSSVSAGGLFVAFYRACCSSPGLFRGLFYVERLGFDPVVVVYQGRLAGPDGPEAFFV